MKRFYKYICYISHDQRIYKIYKDKCKKWFIKYSKYQIENYRKKNLINYRSNIRIRKLVTKLIINEDVNSVI